MAPKERVNYRHLYLSTLIINIVYFGVGESNVWTSPAIPHLKEPDSKFYESGFNEGWLVSCFAVGEVLGPLISGCFMDLIGRKPTTLLIILFMLVSYTLLGIASTVEMLYCARIIGGFSFGMSVSVLPVYVAEISDPNNRAQLNSLPLVSRSLGYFTMYAVGPFVSYTTLILICIAAPLVALLLYFLLPESPYHLVAKDKAVNAQETIELLKKGATKEVVQAEIVDIKKAVEDMKANKRSFGDLFSTRAGIRATYISCGLLFFLQMSGVNVIVSTTESLFSLAQVNISPKVCTLVFGGMLLLISLFGPYLTRRFGYKGPLVVSALGMVLSLSVFGTHFCLIHLGYNMSDFSLVPLVSVVSYMCFCSVGFANCAFAVVGELFSPNIKALGTSLGHSFGFACAFLSIQIFYRIKSSLGIHFGIWTFAVINTFAMFFTLFSVPDTSKMSLLEIQELLNKPWFGKQEKTITFHKEEDC